MLKIPATDNKLYSVPSWSEFKTWIRRAGFAYAILAVATVIGIYAYGLRSENQLKNKINGYAKDSCLASIKKGSVLNKYNDFISAAIESRAAIMVIDSANHESAKVQGDETALQRYKNDFAQIPNKDECKVPVIK